jgi:ribulose-5-phosphate 4-epimerase/fuculose-1-phosphate aldolase
MLTAQRRGDISLEGLTVRQQLAVALRVLERHQIADIAAGHMTLREPGTNTFWTNPWNFEWSTIRASDLVRVDLEGNVLEGDTDPSKFLDVHFLLYQARPDLNCVIHNHPYYVCLYSSLQQPLYILDQQSALFVENHVVYNEYKGLAQGLEITRPMVEAMGQNQNAILKTHGMVTCSDSLDSAVYQAIYMERAAKLSWEATQNPRFNPETDQMDLGVARKTRDAIQTRKQPFFKLNWQAMARQTLRLTPDVLE